MRMDYFLFPSRKGGALVSRHSSIRNPGPMRCRFGGSLLSLLGSSELWSLTLCTFSRFAPGVAGLPWAEAGGE